VGCWEPKKTGEWGRVEICGPVMKDTCPHNECMESRPGSAWFIHNNLAWDS
jgi:hypothetical protein